MIIGLQLLLTTFAYEIHTSQFSPSSGVRDPLLPLLPPRTPSPFRHPSYHLSDYPERQTLFASHSEDDLDDVDLEKVPPRSDFARQLDEDKERHRRRQEESDEDGYVLDLRLQTVIQRLSASAPAIWNGSSSAHTPLLPVTSTGNTSTPSSDATSQVPTTPRPGGGLRGSTPSPTRPPPGGMSWSAMLRNHQAAGAMGRRRLLEELENGLGVGGGGAGGEGDGPPRTS